MSEQAYEAVELAKKTGKIKKGTNEVTKAIEKGNAKLVVIAQDVSPKEITMHIPMLCKDKNIAFIEVPSREELGAAAGMAVSTVAVAITDAGEAKSMLGQFAKKPETKEERPVEEKKEESKAEEVTKEGSPADETPAEKKE